MQWLRESHFLIEFSFLAFTSTSILVNPFQCSTPRQLQQSKQDICKQGSRLQSYLIAFSKAHSQEHQD